MAIREFGESLLADVRSRKDQQVSDQRKEDRKAEKRALIGTAATWLGKEAIGAIRNNMERNTLDFLDTTEAAGTQVKLNKTGDLIEDAIFHRDAAKTANLTLENYFINKTANEVVSKAQVDFPNTIKIGTENEAVSVYSKRKGVIDYANRLASDNKFIIDAGNEYAKGKASLPLNEFLNRQTGRGNFLSYGWKKLTGRLPSDPELMNVKINNLRQVVAANSILDKELQRVQAFAKRGNEKVTAELTNSLVGRFSLLEEKDFKDLVKKGEDIVEITTAITSVPGGHVKSVKTKTDTGRRSDGGEQIIVTKSKDVFVEQAPTSKEQAEVFSKDVISLQNIDALALPAGSNDSAIFAWRVRKEEVAALVAKKEITQAESYEILLDDAFNKNWAPADSMSVDTSGLDVAVAKEFAPILDVLRQDIQTATSDIRDFKAAGQDVSKLDAKKTELMTELQGVLSLMREASSAARTSTDPAAMRKVLAKKIVTSGTETATEISYEGTKYPIITDATTGQRSIFIDKQEFAIGDGT